ncbi:ABC transporter permease [Couchioplanes caeruleus]|uniref:Uncharacterized protein n=2 Tax=Couchioplanes caeruleus TaxID=56438 RepID=A0A1K0GCI9_9ACTN|nr:ABC transporter permease [Couchioplanes caeruleus]OJF09886.1 hypothetical protein BG844_35090 [Couchioplanes caeruleus subsp. caeruleus]ROP27695.1 ABC-2 type transport system permease protein [Couchioplanes caeruleus]
MSRAAGPAAWLLITGAELRSLRRSAFAVVMAAVLPFAIGLLIIWAEGDTGKAGRGGSVGLLLVTLLVFTAYVPGTTALAARRQQLVLKRLRTSGAPDLAVIAGVLTPYALLTVLQSLVLFGIVVVADGPPSLRPLPLLAALGAGIAVACVMAVATAAYTSSPELAQLTTTPIALAFVGGGFWALTIPAAEVGAKMLALPGVGVTQLTRIGWHEAEPSGSAGALAALVLLAAVVTPVAVRVFSWDSRR